MSLAFRHLLGSTGAPLAPAYFADDGATTPIYAQVTYPPAIYVASTTTSWFLWESYEDTHRAIMVTTYNHTTGIWSNNVPVFAHGQSNDSHGAGALIRDADGYIHVYGGSHDSDLYEYVSAAPDDPSSWWLRNTFTAVGGYSYPHPVLVGSSIYLFLREKVNAVSTRRLVVYHTTALSSGVPTWSSQTVLISLGTDSRVYMTTPFVIGTDVHFTWCLANDPDTVRRNGYYARYDTSTGAVKNVDASFSVASGSLPLGRTDADNNYRFLSQTTDQSNLPSLAFDTNGDAHVVIMAGAGATSPALDGTYDVLHYTFTGGSWSAPTTVLSSQTMYRSAELALVQLPSAEMALYYEEDQALSYTIGGNIKQLVRSSGGSWGSATTILAPTVEALSRPTAVQSAHANARVAFTEVTQTDNDSETDAGTLKAYAYGDNGFVRRTSITRDPLTQNLAGTRVCTFLMSSGIPLGARVKLSGFGFQPKAIRLWSSGQGATSVVNGASRPSEGFAVSSSNQVCAATILNDGTDPTDDHTHHRTDCCYMVLTTGGTSAGRLALLTMDADGCTFQVTEAFTGDRYVTLIAYDAAVVTNAIILTIQEAASTGNQGYTGAGFQPDYAAFLGVPDTTAAPNTADNSTWSVGCASSSSSANQWVLAGGGQHNVGTANTMRYARSGEVVAFYNAGVTALDARASLTSFDADGVTLNWIARASTRRVYVLLLKGGSYKVGNTLSSTTLNATISVSSFGFTPLGVQIMADRTGEDTAGSAEAQSYFWCHGAGTSSSNRFGHTVGSTDAAAVEDSMRGHLQTAMIVGFTVTAVQDSLVDLQSLDAGGGGGVTFKQTDPAASQYFLGYDAWA